MDRKKVALKVIAAIVAVVMILAVMPSEASAYTYNRQNAVNYALNNWDKNVPGSNYFIPRGGDCTNFVSNCLKAGGWPEVNEPWRYSQHMAMRTNSYSWYAVPYRNWYSYTWGGANNFGRYVSIYSGRGYARSLSYKPWYRYFSVGDIVQIDYNRDGRWDHTMIVTETTYNDMKMTYHSTNTKNKPLTQIMSENSNARFIGYKLKNSF